MNDLEHYLFLTTLMDVPVLPGVPEPVLRIVPDSGVDAMVRAKLQTIVNCTAPFCILLDAPKETLLTVAFDPEVAVSYGQQSFVTAGGTPAKLSGLSTPVIRTKDAKYWAQYLLDNAPCGFDMADFYKLVGTYSGHVSLPDRTVQTQLALAGGVRSMTAGERVAKGRWFYENEAKLKEVAKVLQASKPVEAVKQLNSYKTNFEAFIDNDDAHMYRDQAYGVRQTLLSIPKDMAGRTHGLLEAFATSESYWLTLIHANDPTPVLTMVPEDVGMITTEVKYPFGMGRMNSIRDNQINELEQITGHAPIIHAVYNGDKARRVAKALLAIDDHLFHFEYIFNLIMAKRYGVVVSRVYNYSCNEPVPERGSLWDKDAQHKSRLWMIAHMTTVLDQLT